MRFINFAAALGISACPGLVPRPAGPSYVRRYEFNNNHNISYVANREI